MRLAMIQMSNSGSVEKNMEKSLHAIAMCNRIGVEGEMDFAGESMAVDANGEILARADDTEQIVYVDINLEKPGKCGRKDLILILGEKSFMYNVAESCQNMIVCIKK